MTNTVLIVVNLGISAYLLWVLNKVVDETVMTDTILRRFIAKIAQEKIEAGEWQEDETF